MASLVTLSEFKAYIGTELTADDVNLQATLDAAESAVFSHLRRRVVLASGGAASRLFVPLTRWIVETDDFTTLSAVSNDGTAVVASGYQLEPLNGLSVSGEYRPYSRIRLLSSYWSSNWASSVDNRLRLPGEATVSVTAVWGWASIPAAVKLAVMMVGKDMRTAKDVQYGLLFTDQAAVRIRQNSTVLEMLRDYRKDPVMVA